MKMKALDLDNRLEKQKILITSLGITYNSSMTLGVPSDLHPVMLEVRLSVGVIGHVIQFLP